MSERDVGVVLARGWADGSSWSKVIAGLRSERVKAVSAPPPLTSLADDVAALDQMLERVDGPVVVAGHAYAGAVIASTSDEKVASLVYVAALAPDEGETVGDVYYRAEPHPQAPVLSPDRHALTWLPRKRSPGLSPSTPRRRSRRCWPPRSGHSRRLASASRCSVRLEGQAETVPCGRGGSHDPRPRTSVHGRADEGARASASRRPHAHAHGTVRGRRHRAGSGA